MIIDYAFKSYVLKEHADLLKQQKRTSLYEYSLNNYRLNGVVNYTLKHNKNNLALGELLKYCIDNNLMNEYLESVKINHAEYERNKRLKSRIATMLNNGACVFLTLTFNDKTLAETDAKKRRVAVVRYLKQFNCMYIANIDFGGKNNREHYHALVNAESVDFKHWRKYGNINAEKVRLKDNEKDNIKLAKYIAKLGNHAIKETAKRGALIYSR